LDGGQVDPEDLALGMGICKIDGPDPGPGTDVEDAVQGLRFGDWSGIEEALQGQAEEVVLEIEAVIFGLIVGERICAVLAVG
jgi:hypothetical protein